MGSSAFTIVSLEEAVPLNGVANVDALLNRMLSATDAKYTGSANASYLTGSIYLGELGTMLGGLILTTGGKPSLVNNGTEQGVDNNSPGDKDLTETIVSALPNAQATYDAASVSYTWDVDNAYVKGYQFDILFASEEYPKSSKSDFVDVAAFYVNGVNYALFDHDPKRPLSVIDENLPYFIDNQDGKYPIEYDGFTTSLSIRVPLVQGINTIKIGLADTKDAVLDSALLIQAGKYIYDGGLTGEPLASFKGSKVRDVFRGDDLKQLFELNGGSDQINYTNISQLDGDVITSFSVNDRIIVENAELNGSQFKYDKTSGIVEVDADNDGAWDMSFSVLFDAQVGTFTVTQFDGGSAIYFDVPKANPIGLLPLFGIQSQLQIIYLGYFNRAADDSGLSFWAGQNRAAQKSGQTAEIALTNIANSFQPQLETLANYPLLGTPGLNLVDPSTLHQLGAFVDNVYQNLFNRQAETAGRDYWVQQIATGNIGFGAAVLAIANGATEADAITIMNKVDVANYFTTSTKPLKLETNVEFLSFAKSIVSHINSNGATTVEPVQSIDAFIIENTKIGPVGSSSLDALIVANF